MDSLTALLLNRRQFLGGLAGAAGFALLKPWDGILNAHPRFATTPFTLGIASGDPIPTGVVLWTRLAPSPFEPGYGMEPHAVPVRWQVAKDESMRQIVRHGTTTASPELGHSVHVELEGLEPETYYWYQFEVGGVTSEVGRTRTAPALGSHPERFRFAFASCQNWPVGYYAAYRAMAHEDLDLVVHLGDYIYEGNMKEKTQRAELTPELARPEIVTLDQYRMRYALYKMDPDLQRAHARFPWVVTWDDHEVDNNYASDHDQDGTAPAEFLKRRAQAYQAYYENQPLRRVTRPRGADMRLYRRLSFGDLLQVNVLDTRQYRSDQANGDGAKARTGEALDPQRTMMGATQTRWLQDNLKRSDATWNVIAQQLIMSQFARQAKDGTVYSMDAWDGYLPERTRLMKFLHEQKVANPVVLSGDSHTNLVSDLKLDFDARTSPTVGVEFAGTSISSNGVSAAQQKQREQMMTGQDHLKWFEGTKRGYMSCHLDRKTWRTDVYQVVDVTDAGSRVHLGSQWAVEAGEAGVKPA